MSRVMVGIDGKVSEVVVATCLMRWREFDVSKDVVGDAMARENSSKSAMKAPEGGIARQLAWWIAFVRLWSCEERCLDVTQVLRLFCHSLGVDVCLRFRETSEV